MKNQQNQYIGLAERLMERRLEMKSFFQDLFAPINSLDHRLRHIVSINGVDYIDDSKATNINSTWYALEVIEKPIILILGGVDKGNDYSQLDDLVKEKVKYIVQIGTEQKKIQKHFKDIVAVIPAKSMEHCVWLCYRLAKAGDTVLLSPACASFDEFENYQDRGQRFEQMIKKI